MILNNLKKTYYKFYIVAQDSNTPSLLNSMISCEINLFSSLTDQLNGYLNDLKFSINLNSDKSMFCLNDLLFKSNETDMDVIYGLDNDKQLPFQLDIINGNLHLVYSNLKIVKSYEFNVILNNLIQIQLYVNINNKDSLQFEKDYYDAYLDVYWNAENSILLPANFIKAFYPSKVLKSNIKYYLLSRTLNLKNNRQQLVDLNLLFHFNSTNAQLSRLQNDDYFETFLNIFNNATSIYPLFQVLAVDEYNPDQNTSTILRINFNNTLDIKLTPTSDKPKFKKLYSTHVLEKSSIGTFLFHIELDWSTTRNDSTRNDVNYLFLNSDGKHSTMSSTNDFLIDSKSGLIYVNKILDREIQDTYILNIIAVSPKWIIQTDASIYVDDVNDNEPIFSTNSSVIELNLNQLLYSFSSEKLVRMNLFQLMATDSDIDLNGQVYYTYDSSVNGLFSVNPLNGLLSINFNSDTNTLETSRYELKIIAFDRGLPQLSSNALNVTICITSRFERDRVVELAVPYNIFNNSILYTFDYSIRELILLGLNKTYNFLMYNKANNNLNINTEMISRNMINSSFLYVLKMSAESDYIFSSIKLTITDQNLFKPKLLLDKTQIHITQSADIGTEIYRFFAIDHDYGLNGLLKYKLDDRIEASNKNNEKITISTQQLPFQLDSASGSLILKRKLNESDVYFKYNLTVYAVDTSFFKEESNKISLIVFIYDKYFNFLFKRTQQPLYLLLNQQVSHIDLNKLMNENFPELIINSSITLDSQNCLSFKLEDTCFSVINTKYDKSNML